MIITKAPKTIQLINSWLADSIFFKRPSDSLRTIYKIIPHAYVILNHYEASFTFASSVSDFLVFSVIDYGFRWSNFYANGA